jgi:hypothetical protein
LTPAGNAISAPPSDPEWVKNFASAISSGRAVLVEQAAQRAAARNLYPFREAGVAQIGPDLHDGHRRRRRQIMRVDKFSEMLRETWKLRIDLQLHTRGEKAETFEQALDIRVRAFEAFEPEPPGDLRIFFGELAAHFPQVLEFRAVVFDQFRVHVFSARRFGRSL